MKIEYLGYMNASNCRSVLTLVILALASTCFAQVAEPRTTPKESDLRRMGVAATPAEAKPLIDELDGLAAAHFEARRAARRKMQGKSNAEKQQIWQEMLAAEKTRRERMSTLEYRVRDIRKQAIERSKPKEKEGSR